ncbi:NADH:flavin oxidoreductase [Aquabacter spiritensis]|uniref:2,4-dienoyl-CoA reductase-like NADH-dependent reductase (Old Yellow Enzyme family) n=1 Tax=Aquabacter spiritensis TaxID=933073 RepID=A0A4R3LYD9_9HYPH|nr:NADH:flavin oxidoreductase [Aquabacter spiritensis]TCT05711.1 2,4-dienoyl-CoA reductase-like NADH-dependent reductase (Old Yellow Enzyme family) [Aquabacter spiritensis]
MKYGDFPKITSLSGVAGFRAHLAELGIDMPCDDIVAGGPDSPLAAPLDVDGMRIGNRFAIHPMEGWDGTREGAPTENTERRWRRFGESGAKLIFGGEAVAVRQDGRANPLQLVMSAQTQGAIARLRETVIAAHTQAAGSADGLVIGLQLTHSGRFCKPNDNRRFEQMILYRHPVLDRKFGIPAEYPVMSDDDIFRLIDDYIAAARRAEACGYDFVDLKHCHGYLGHEFLSAKTRPGPFGGPIENRTRFLRELVAGIRAACPRLKLAMRVSAIDLIAYRPDPERSLPGALGPGVPDDAAGALPYRYGFGTDAADPTAYDLSETFALLDIVGDLGIRLVNVTLGSPYYNPHLTRPASYPPSDGYHPPEDPLIGVMRHLDVVRALKAHSPEMTLLGSGYTYLQEYLPNVAQAVVRQGWTDLVGLGRMVLSYPDLPLDVLSGRGMQKKKICRTFSDCTTAPRNGIVSGCYPLDGFYKQSAEFKQLAAIKKAAKSA